jgi:hypothetical protein
MEDSGMVGGDSRVFCGWFVGAASSAAAGCERAVRCEVAMPTRCVVVVVLVVLVAPSRWREEAALVVVVACRACVECWMVRGVGGSCSCGVSSRWRVKLGSRAAVGGTQAGSRLTCHRAPPAQHWGARSRSIADVCWEEVAIAGWR